MLPCFSVFTGYQCKIVRILATAAEPKAQPTVTLNSLANVFLAAVLLAGSATCAHAAESASQSVYVQAEVSDFVRRQLTIRDELKEGVTRLQRACKKKPIAGAAELREEQRLVAAHLVENRQRSAAAEKVADNATRDYVQQLQKTKGGRCNALKAFFIDRTGSDPETTRFCARLDEELKAAQGLRERFLEYQSLSRSRSELFQEMLKLEARDCVRADFTNRMLSVYEPSNLAIETGVGEFFSNSVNKLRQSFAPPEGVER